MTQSLSWFASLFLSFFLNFSWMLFPTFQRREEKSVVCSAHWKKALCAFSAAVLLKFRVPRLELLLLNPSLVRTSRAAHAKLLGFTGAVHSPQPTRHPVCSSLPWFMLHNKGEPNVPNMSVKPGSSGFLGASIEAVWMGFFFFLSSFLMRTLCLKIRQLCDSGRNCLTLVWLNREAMAGVLQQEFSSFTIFLFWGMLACVRLVNFTFTSSSDCSMRKFSLPESWWPFLWLFFPLSFDKCSTSHFARRDFCCLQ